MAIAPEFHDAAIAAFYRRAWSLVIAGTIQKVLSLSLRVPSEIEVMKISGRTQLYIFPNKGAFHQRIDLVNYLRSFLRRGLFCVFNQPFQISSIFSVVEPIHKPCIIRGSSESHRLAREGRPPGANDADTPGPRGRRSASGRATGF